jgi:hydroxymethylbilane synthase
LRKLWASLDFDATLLAAAGLVRLGWDLSPTGRLRIDPRYPAAVRAALEPPPDGIQGTLMEPTEMLPAPGQGAIGLEIRSGDDRSRELCRSIHHRNTGVAVEAERSFLSALGGGCQLPVGAWGRVLGHQVVLTVDWYRDGRRFTAEDRAPVQEASQLGARVGATVKRDR